MDYMNLMNHTLDMTYDAMLESTIVYVVYYGSEPYGKYDSLEDAEWAAEELAQDVAEDTSKDGIITWINKNIEIEEVR